MNERIRELKQQAEAYVDSVDDGLGIEHYRELVDLKFARLLVEESFRVSLVEGKGYLDPVKLRNAMYKHFGVEL
jgi:molybdate-binding protein